MSKLMLSLLVGAIMCLGLVACGGESDPTTADPGGAGTETGTTTEPTGNGPSVAIAADPNGALAFTETEISAPPGEAAVTFENASKLPHDVCILDAGGVDLGCSDIIASADDNPATNSFDVELDAGEYTFYCSLPGHRQAGMEGVLAVE